MAETCRALRQARWCRNACRLRSQRGWCRLMARTLARRQMSRTWTIPRYQARRLRGRPVQSSQYSAEQGQKRDEKREDAQSFGHGEAEDQAAELAVGSRRIAQRAREVAAEDVAQANARATHAQASDAGADVLCCFCVHLFNSFGSEIPLRFPSGASVGNPWAGNSWGLSARDAGRR